MKTAVLARHGENTFSARGLVNGDIAVAAPLTARGEAEARALGEAIRDERIDLCVTSEFERTQQTADVALAGRQIPRLVLPDLNDPSYGEFEGRPLDEYREWARSHGSEEAPPGGESRRDLLARYARAFRIVLDRPEDAVLAVAHSLPIAYVLGEPQPRMPMVEHAAAHVLTAAELEESVERLEAWLAAPTW